jgi:uncharacterized protein YeeX (DUF496 family)
MNRLIFSGILISAWIVFIAINKNFFFDQLLAMPGDIINNSSNFSAPTIERDLGIEDNKLQDSNLQNQIQSELYDSISSGMSYEEVSSIIGWSGVLIYENKVKDAGAIIQTKVYQWDHEDVYSTNTTSINSERAGIINPYGTLTLEFQDDILVDKTFSYLKP